MAGGCATAFEYFHFMFLRLVFRVGAEAPGSGLARSGIQSNCAWPDLSSSFLQVMNHIILDVRTLIECRVVRGVIVLP
jgi:hypothetical protein